MIERQRVCQSIGAENRGSLYRMALRLEKAFGVWMDTLVRMQASYDIVRTRRRAKSIHVRPYRRPVA